MATFFIYRPDGDTLTVDAEKAIKSGQQTVFYDKDGSSIVAQIPTSWGFIKKGK